MAESSVQSLKGQDLRACNPATIIWRRADLRGADLRGVTFNLTNLREASFAGAEKNPSWLVNLADRTALRLSRGENVPDTDITQSLGAVVEEVVGGWLKTLLGLPPSASFALNWATGPLGWSITAGTDRADSRGFSPGADLTTTYRF